MEYPILDRIAFLVERSDIPCALPTQNPAEQRLLSVMEDQKMLLALLVCSLIENQILNADIYAAAYGKTLFNKEEPS